MEPLIDHHTPFRSASGMTLLTMKSPHTMHFHQWVKTFRHVCFMKLPPGAPESAGVLTIYGGKTCRYTSLPLASPVYQRRGPPSRKRDMYQ